MESSDSIPNSSTSLSKSIALNYEMDSSNEDIDQQVLREAGEQTISAEWSATVSALNSLDTTSSNSCINIETLKACCANPSDTLKDKEDFMIFESSSAVNTSKFNVNDTKYNLECKTTAFQKKYKPISQNFSRVFENVLNDDSQMEITQNSICLNRFQKRKRLIPPNDEDFIEINNSNYSGSDNVEISMMKSPKFCFSKKKKKEKFDIPDYNFSATESVSISDDTNISKIKENISNLPLVVNDSSNNIMEVSKAEVLTQKFSRKTIGVPDTAFDNIINDSSLISDIAPNNKKTSLNDISVSNINSTPMFSKTSMSSLNYTYDVPINTNSTVKNSISSDADVSRVKQNIVFKKPLNSSVLVNDSSNNMDVSNTEIFIHKFNRKKIDITNSAFDNILNDSSMTFDTAMNNKNTSLNENSVSNVNSTPVFSKASMPNLNYTYDVLINTDYTTVKESIADDADISRVKQNTGFKIPSNLCLVNDSSNNMDVSNTEIFINKFSRKTIDVADSVFENIINDSNITSDNILNNKDTSSNKTFVSNVYDTPGFSKINITNLNHTYDIPINIDSSKIDVSITADNKIVKVKQNAGFKKSSTVVNDSSVNIMDLSKTEVFTHKFSRKTIDVTNSVFDNIINDSSMVSDNILNNKKSLIQTPVLNVNNTPVFNKMDSSNLNHYSNEAQKTQSKESIISTSSNEGLSLTNSSTGFSERRSSSRNKSKSSKNSTSVISNNDSSTLSNTTIGSLDGNESQKSQLKRSIISPSTNNESLKSKQSTTGFSERRSSSNQSTPSKHSTSVISNNDSLTLLNTTTESLESNESQKSQLKRSIISPSTINESLKSKQTTTGFLERHSSRNQSTSSKHSTSTISNNDGLTLLHTTMGSLEGNDSQISLSMRSISPSTNNESLKSTNSTIGFSERHSSSRNKSISSKHSTSAISDNDTLTLLNTTMESLESNESQKSLSKSLISLTNNEILQSTDSITGFSERRSLSINKSTSSKHSLSVISNNDNSTSLNVATGISVSSRSSRPINDNLTMLSTAMESLEGNKSQKSLSKRSISSANNESLKSTNSTTEFSERRSSSRNKSKLTKHLTSAISNNDSLTLLNTTMESLVSNESQESQSKRSISPSLYNESLKSTNSTTEISKRRSSSRNKSSLYTSKHSTSVISNKDSTALLNSTTGFSERRNSRNQSTSSKHSTSAISNNDSLALLNTTMESLENNESQKSQSKRSISPFYNESLNSTNSTTEISKRRSSSRNKSSLLTSKHSTSVISNKDSTALLNSTIEISVNDKSAKNKSQYCTSVISKNDNLTLLNATIESVENYKAQKIQSKHLKSPTFNIEASTTLNTTAGSLKQNILEQKSNCLSNVEPVTSIDIDKLTNSDCLTIKNTTTLEQKVMSINQSNSSPNTSIKMSINRLEDDPNFNNKIHSLLSKQENHSYDSIEQVKPNITDGSLVENKSSSKTRVLRSSLRNNKNKSLFTKSLVSNSINNLCTGSARPSKSVVNFNNESFNSNSDNSLFWTTLPDETTSISNTQNINVNTFQTPISNKLIIAENIANTIKIMSTNKQKSTHPGAFELDDHNNGPLTRSFVTRSCNHSPSILTLVFGGQQISESTSSLTHSLSETIIDQSQVEENIKQKFKSLYKKESWITKRLYKFLTIKLQPNYNIYSVKYAEKFIKYLAMLLKQIYNDNVNLQLYTDMLRYHMARYGIIKDTFDYLGFLSDYIPMAYYKKLVPGWNLEISAVKFDPQKYYIPLMDDEEFLNYIMKHLKEA